MKANANHFYKRIFSVSALLLIAAMLCGCSGLRPLEKAVGSFSDTEFVIVGESDTYTYEDLMFGDMTEQAIHTSADALIKANVLKVYELKVRHNSTYYGVNVTDDPEISANAENGTDPTFPNYTLDEKKEWVEVYVTVVEMEVSKIYYDGIGKLREGKSIRVMLRTSSRSHDSQSMYLADGDECVIFLNTTNVQDDTMKLYSRNIASYYVPDSKHSIIKKSGDGWIYDNALEFFASYSTPMTEVLGLTAENAAEKYGALDTFTKKHYENAEAYYERMSTLSLIPDKYIDELIKNNVYYYYHDFTALEQ